MSNEETLQEEFASDEEKKSGGMTRRQLCMGVGGAAAVLALGGVRFLPSNAVVRPPGAQDEERLTSLCVRCQKCYEACPQHVIAPSHIENGIMQMRTPTMKFSDNWCDFCSEANGGSPLCAKTCPTGAISLQDDAKPETTIIGKAVINQDWCLAYRLTGCKFCYDACPYDALGLDDKGRPFVVADRCNGCGACESVCVSLQNGSISSGATARAIVIEPLVL